MAKYGGTVRSITPATNDDNWILEAGAVARTGRIVEFYWGGEATTSTAMCTRVARGSGQAGAGTAGNVAKFHPNHVTNVISFFTTYATTQPTLDAGDLFALSWNCHGGVAHWSALSADDGLFLLGNATPASGATICCRNTVGTGTSTYGTVWMED